MLSSNAFNASIATGLGRFSPSENARQAIRLSPDQAITQRQAIKDQHITQLSDALWLSRDGDTVVAKACKSAFNALGTQADKQDAAKQHILCYAALKLDKLIQHGSYLASPKVNKQVLADIATMLEIDRHSAGKSALESAARVLVDRVHLDRVEHVDPAIMTAVRDRLVLKTLHCLTEKMNRVVDKHIEKKGLDGKEGHSFSSAQIDHKVYDLLLIHKQVQRGQDLNALRSGLV
jgi:hypothetical protein